MKIAIAILIALAFLNGSAQAQQTVVYSKEDSNLLVGSKIELLEDKSGSMDINQVLQSAGWMKNDQQVPNLPMGDAAFWAKLQISNQTGKNDLALNLAYPTIDSVTLYAFAPGNHLEQTIGMGEYLPYYKREIKHQDYIFHLNIPPGETRLLLLRIRASEQVQLPLTLGSMKSIDNTLFTKDLIFGLYCGIILVMFFYNLFIYFSVRDNIYLYYVAYIFAVGFTQACVQGYAARFFYPDSARWANFMMVLMPMLSGVTALEFLKRFIDVKKYTPVLYKVIYVFLFVYLVVTLMGVVGKYSLAQQLLQVNAMVASIVVIIIAVKISRKGYRPAQFFLLAWAIFLSSVVVFVLRNFNVLPYNNFTYYSLQIGSSLEVILLSFALADRINLYKKEKEASQAMALRISQENERLIREQNVILEEMVAERTEELQATNEHLNEALTDLKDAQTQLVDAEKMASLGQLTAGIAHEINNPINFVKSNIKPLRLDIQDLFDVIGKYGELSHEKDSTAMQSKLLDIEELKREIDLDLVKAEITRLIEGIEDGAERTAEIVRGLRTFSRLDESELKQVNIHDGIESTLVLLRNSIPPQVKILKDFRADGNIECYPGKLNQVFMNILNNAVQAIQAKKDNGDSDFISILTNNAGNDSVEIHIKDSGIGMTEEVKQKIYEPFFTTKDVGEGTGLGMAIVFKIVGTHHGRINIVSEPGKGAEFIITLPRIQPIA